MTDQPGNALQILEPSLASSALALISVSCNGLSDNSRRVYTARLKLFLASRPPHLDRAAVTAYLESRIRANTSATALNQDLAAIKRLACECAANGLMDVAEADRIAAIKSRKIRGTRAGNWLTLDQIRTMLNLPDCTSLNGLRDRALLALLIGCGLRRSECSGLQAGQMQERAVNGIGTMYLVDVIGKGGRLRTIAMPEWTVRAVREWLQAAQIESGYVLRSFRL